MSDMIKVDQVRRFNAYAVEAMKAVADLGNYAVREGLDHEKIKQIATDLSEIQFHMMWAEQEEPMFDLCKDCGCDAPIIETGVDEEGRVCHLVVYAEWSAVAMRKINGLDHKKYDHLRAICSRCGARAYPE